MYSALVSGLLIAQLTVGCSLLVARPPTVIRSECEPAGGLVILDTAAAVGFAAVAAVTLILGASGGFTQCFEDRDGECSGSGGAPFLAAGALTGLTSAAFLYSASYGVAVDEQCDASPLPVDLR